MKHISILCLILALFSFFSCSSRIDGSLAADGSASMSVNMSLGARITVLIRSIGVAAGQPQSGPVIDGESISRAMTASPGIAQASFRNTSQSALEGTLRISRVSDFLADTSGINAGGAGFIAFEQNNSGGRFAVNINRNNSAQIAKLLPPEMDDYLNALMAPFTTGDEMTKAEYLELIEQFYNKPISDEVASSRIRISLEFPGTITSVTGGTYSGRRAEFDIPLTDLLVLESPVNLEVRWR